MKIAVLGTGMVGHSIATKLVTLGHDVTMGSRTADNEKGVAWADKYGERAHVATFKDAASDADMVFNCTSGTVTLEVLGGIRDVLKGKVVVDLANPLDFSAGFPPSLFTCNTTSLGEQVQAALPEAKVVKALNTVGHEIMVNPRRIPGEHFCFVCGNDAEAKAEVAKLLTEGFGWKQVLDLGDIDNARGTEAFLLLWTRMFRALGTGDFNLELKLFSGEG